MGRIIYGSADGYRLTSIFGGIRSADRKCWKIWFRNDGDLEFWYGGHFEKTGGAFVTESTIIDEAPIAKC